MRLSDDLHKQLKMRSVEADTSMQEILTTLIEFALMNVEAFDASKGFSKKYREAFTEYLAEEKKNGAPEK